MKKIISLLLVFMLILPTVGVMAENDISITIDGKKLELDVSPIEENDRVLVPMRGIFEELGATVTWDDATWTVTATRNETKIILHVGSKSARVNREDVPLDVPAKIIDGRTMVPVRFVAETLGCTVDWEDATKTVIIKSPVKTALQEKFDGKKVLFIGNSFIHYGRTVDTVNKKYFTLEERQDTKGGFYQLCKANGIDISVTNWTISSHKLNDLLGPNECSVCKTGIIHEEHLTDKYYDYVFFSPSSAESQNKTFLEDVEYIEKTFKEANPNVEIICIGNVGAYGYSSSKYVWENREELYKAVEEKGIKVLDWGKIVTEVIAGTRKVPESKETYTASTFIITKDNYHPNLLTGYITTLLAYCTMTGESAVGQTYNYISDATLAPTFDLPGYVDYYYKNGDDDTNFPEILNSESEMKGIQMLVDEYLGKKDNKNMLDGKKIAFIGDSNVYWGRVVNGNSKSVHEQSKRENNEGVFYQICKANGAEVNVLDWTWGSHGLWTLFSGEPCTLKGKCLDLNHEEALTDKNFDYVVIGLTRSETDEAAMLEQFEHITKIFKEANPNVKIIALAPAMIYGYNDKDTVRQGTIDNLKVIEEKFDVTIVDWGRIVKDLCEGTVKVPGATQEYNRNTFVITKDNKHPSLLAGYITSLMTYCAITGEKAEGQPYDFFFKEEFASTFGIPAFVEGNYANAEETTMEEIFNSEADMKGLQQLIDKYLAEKPYRK